MLTMVEKNYAGNLSSWVFYDLNISPNIVSQFFKVRQKHSIIFEVRNNI